MYPGSDTGAFDVSMEFYNTASVDFVGPYATTAYAGDEETTVRVRILLKVLFFPSFFFRVFVVLPR